MTDQALRKFVEGILYSDIVPDSAPEQLKVLMTLV